MVQERIAEVVAGIEARSRDLRAEYLELIRAAAAQTPSRRSLSCSNLAHAYAGCPADRYRLRGEEAPALGIVTAYNDVLSAHRPYEDYPTRIRAHARELGAAAQVAGGVPAMCDGVTQGQRGMELSLFSRDVIAQATAVALSHQLFDAVLCLGICDKIVPGLFIGAARFGHLPVLFVPGGPMPPGIPNREKARVRQLYAEGKVGREELLAVEEAAYHSPGTCTFYGTANTNQVVVEALGLQLPGSSFVNPGTALREALTREAVAAAVRASFRGPAPRRLGEVIDARALVNAMVAVLASGGSTNHSIHLVAMARAVGYRIDWDDFAALSAVVPLLARVYPNGEADVNRFHAAGGTSFLFRELLAAGLLDGDAATVWGGRMAEAAVEPALEDGALTWRPAAAESRDREVLRPVADPFDAEGGLRLLSGNLGRAIVKVSAVPPGHRRVEAPAVVVASQAEVEEKFRAGSLFRDCVVVVRFQGPRANGMPEMHKLTPLLGVVQDRGHAVALVTDGRMSGASGKVLAALHLTPEAAAGGPLAKVRDGDRILVDAERGLLELCVPAEELAARLPARPHEEAERGVGRELFALFRRHVTSAEEGATVLFPEGIGG
ncbi:MAG: phosphogluconate dehydratase [Porticoccaceae bacterium]|nr:MAG: phosphogluconate dehydratase [Porticoccaceae bacterium]